LGPHRPFIVPLLGRRVAREGFAEEATLVADIVIRPGTERIPTKTWACLKFNFQFLDDFGWY
jgi:hypothetical protein